MEEDTRDKINFLHEITCPVRDTISQLNCIYENIKSHLIEEIKQSSFLNFHMSDQSVIQQHMIEK